MKQHGATMPLTCGATLHRVQLLASDWAACYDCLKQFRPREIVYWTDDGDTALCPFCGLDFVLGFSGSVDEAFLMEANERQFGSRRRRNLKSP